jgi:hypothetical protein
MRELAGLIYEVTLDVDSEIIAEFDLWLASHVADMLALDAFRDAQVFECDSTQAGQLRRVVHYFPTTESALQEYFVDAAAAMRQAGIDKFGNKLTTQRRILKDAELPDGAATPRQPCLNCGVTLTGQYCGNCGQRASSRLISIWQLSKEAFGDLFEIDSRVWQTLVPLLIRPGRLTSYYLQGKRARFMPPFRMYIVLSVLFFLVAFFDPSEKFSLFYPADAVAPVADQVIVHDDIAATIDALEKQIDGIPEGTSPSLKASLSEIKKTAGTSDIKTDCDVKDYDTAPSWLTRRLTREHLLQICERIQGDDGKSLLRGLLDNVPAFLILFLPILALIMKVLYPLSKRYYVEHLLFVVHLHAFFFLLLTLQIIFTRTVELLSFSSAAAGVATACVSIYIPIYLYKGMREVYGQNRWITFGKFAILATSYVIGFGLMLAMALLFTAISM